MTKKWKQRYQELQEERVKQFAEARHARETQRIEFYEQHRYFDFLSQQNSTLKYILGDAIGALQGIEPHINPAKRQDVQRAIAELREREKKTQESVHQLARDFVASLSEQERERFLEEVQFHTEHIL